jgi:hypothetical protein
MRHTLVAFAAALLLAPLVARAADAPASTAPLAALLAGKFKWISTAPLIATNDADRGVGIKDPTIVFHEGHWHIYATLRLEKAAIMEHLSFADWKAADTAERHVIGTDESYHCAPQLFYFRPQGKWYLIHQWKDRSVVPANYGPCWSTLESPGKPQTLTRPVMLFPRKPANVPCWIDFWVICDDVSAHLFFTGDDGTFWRCRTPLASFPAGWTEPQLVLKQATNEFFEATHTYRLKGMAKYLTLAEAIGPQSCRYYKAYLADRLDGDWKPLAGSWDQPFASVRNVTFAPGVAPWTESISHGELLRDGTDETLTVDPAHLRFLFQGCLDKERAGKKYSQIPWRLGILE